MIRRLLERWAEARAVHDAIAADPARASELPAAAAACEAVAAALCEAVATEASEVDGEAWYGASGRRRPSVSRRYARAEAYDRAVEAALDAFDAAVGKALGRGGTFEGYEAAYEVARETRDAALADALVARHAPGDDE
jgi:hypothetical protein